MTVLHLVVALASSFAAPAAAQVASIDDLWNPPALEMMAPSTPKDDPIDRFSTYVLNHDYDLFGTLTTRFALPSMATGVQTDS